MKKTSFAIIVLIFISCGYGYSQSQQTEQTMKKNSSQEDLIVALEKRVADAGNDYISLTGTEYELLLSQPVGDIEGFEPLTTVMGGIMIGYGFSEGPKIYKTDIQIIFPNIPNINEGEVFIILDHVIGNNGLDYLDRESNTEIKTDGSNPENDFTALMLDNRTVGSKSYWFGSRYVNLRDPYDSITVRALGALGGDVELSEVSGKVVMQLPVNITELSLSKAEVIRKEYPFSFGSERRDVQEKVIPAAPAEVAAAAPVVYLDTNDPISKAIKARAINDLRQSVNKTDPESAESKLITEQIEALSKEKQDQLQEIFLKSINDYLVQTRFDVTVFNYGTFMLLYSDLGKMDLKKIATEYEIRVQSLGGDQYAAEFWEDTQVHAQAAAGNPNAEDIEIFKELIRLSSGKKSVSKKDGATTMQMVALPYTKMFGLLYSLEKDGEVTFHDPFQPMIDFIKP